MTHKATGKPRGFFAFGCPTPRRSEQDSEPGDGCSSGTPPAGPSLTDRQDLGLVFKTIVQPSEITHLSETVPESLEPGRMEAVPKEPNTPTARPDGDEIKRP